MPAIERITSVLAENIAALEKLREGFSIEEATTVVKLEGLVLGLQMALDMMGDTGGEG